MIQWEGEIKQQIQKKNIFELKSIVKTQIYNNYEKAPKGQCAWTSAINSLSLLHICFWQYCGKKGLMFQGGLDALEKYYVAVKKECMAFYHIDVIVMEELFWFETAFAIYLGKVK